MMAAAKGFYKMRGDVQRASPNVHKEELTDALASILEESHSLAVIASESKYADSQLPARMADITDALIRGCNAVSLAVESGCAAEIDKTLRREQDMVTRRFGFVDTYFF